jgi:DtxR family Mn-dependent transcriptional regulator
MFSGDTQLSASLEDYLEAIHHIVAQKQAARAKDIVMRLGVHNSSVTQALRALSEKGLVNYAPYDLITLTENGKRLANDVVKRHETLKEFLVKVLAVEDAAAEDNACKMEHTISGVVLDRLVKYMEYVEGCSTGQVRWYEELGFFCADCDPHTNGHHVCGRNPCPRWDESPEVDENAEATGN